jgi:hypothetical protein
VAQTSAKEGTFSTGSWLKPVLKVPYKLVLKLCEFFVTSWPYESVLTHPLVWVRNTTGAKGPDNSKQKPFFLLVQPNHSQQIPTSSSSNVLLPSHGTGALHHFQTLLPKFLSRRTWRHHCFPASPDTSTTAAAAPHTDETAYASRRQVTPSRLPPTKTGFVHELLTRYRYLHLTSPNFMVPLAFAHKPCLLRGATHRFSYAPDPEPHTPLPFHNHRRHPVKLQRRAPPRSPSYAAPSNDRSGTFLRLTKPPPTCSSALQSSALNSTEPPLPSIA